MGAFTLRASPLRGGDYLRATVATSPPAASISPSNAISAGGLARESLTMTRGDTAIWTVALSGLPSTGVTGGQFTFTAKKTLADSDASAVLQKTLANGISVTNPGSATTSATVLIVVQPADTAALVNAEQLLLWDLQYLDASGTKTTLLAGYMTVEPEVTLN